MYVYLPHLSRRRWAAFLNDKEVGSGRLRKPSDGMAFVFDTETRHEATAAVRSEAGFLSIRRPDFAMFLAIDDEQVAKVKLERAWPSAR